MDYKLLWSGVAFKTTFWWSQAYRPTDKPKQDFMPALAKRKLDVVPLWLKIWLINRYGLCKGKRNHAEFVIFLNLMRKKYPHAPKLWHYIMELTRLVYIPRSTFLTYTEYNGLTGTPQVPLCQVAALICVCVCVCVRLSARVKLGCHNVLWITGLYVRDKERQCVCGSERRSRGMFSSHVSSTESFCFR